MGLIKRSRIEDKGEIIILDRPLRAVEEEEPELHEPPPMEVTISDVELRAREIIKKANEEAESIRLKAQEKGLSQGKSEAQAKIKEALEILNQAVIERKKIIRDAEDEILRLAIKAAEQVIRSEVSLQHDVCLNIVSDAINRVSDREQVIVRVNREDADYIKRYKDKLSGIVDGIKSFSILEDSGIEPGGCIIETNLGYVDARISTKLSSIEDVLMKVSQEGGGQT